MALAVLDKTVKDKQQESRTVRISAEAYEAVSKAARMRGQDIGAYLSEIAIPIAKRDQKKEAKKILDDEE